MTPINDWPLWLLTILAVFAWLLLALTVYVKSFDPASL